MTTAPEHHSPSDTGDSTAFLAVLEETTRTRPNAVALVDESLTYTYAELLRGVVERSERLNALGVRPHDRVALVAENSADYAVTAFAVWRIGAVLVTVYPSTPPDDLRVTLQDADPVLVLTDRWTDAAVREALGCSSGHLPVTDLTVRDADGVSLAPAVPTPEELRDRLHMICYSSGTTSRPKAIMLTEEGLRNGARTYAEVWRLGPEDVSLVSLPMAWLYGLNTTTMATLLAGGTAVCLRRARPEALVHAIQTHQVTVLTAVTTVLNKLVAHLSKPEITADVSSLRLVVSGGEPRNEAAFALLEKFTGIPVHDTYCASENFPLITYDPVRDPVPRPGAAGQLVPRSELRVVADDGTEVEPGETGEAQSRGAGLFLGYWNDEATTAKSLTADGWYRTNDLVRIDNDGYVYVVGRKSDMIIRGGSNVSPAEVEQILLNHPSVAEAAVVGRPDPVYGEEVVAVVVPASGTALDPEDVRAFVATRASGFKVPTVLKIAEQLPYNDTTQKVNRRMLKAQLENGEI
jgi:long-chain acyl-CoA synthetase